MFWKQCVLVSQITFYLTKTHSILTPTNQTTNNKELLSGREGKDQFCVEIKPFAKHPEEVAGGEILRQ